MGEILIKSMRFESQKRQLFKVFPLQLFLIVEVVSIVSAETVTVAHKTTTKTKQKVCQSFFLFVFHINFDIQTVRKRRKQVEDQDQIIC